MFKFFTDINYELVRRLILDKQGIAVIRCIPRTVPCVSLDDLGQTVNNCLFNGIPRGNAVYMSIREKDIVQMVRMVDRAGRNQDILIVRQIASPDPVNILIMIVIAILGQN